MRHGRGPAEGTPTTVHLLRWRAVAAALPAVALLGGGLALAGGGAPSNPTHGAGASVTRGATLPVIPTAPITQPGNGSAPGLTMPAPAGGSGSFTLDAQGIPGPALAAYHRAAGVIGNADPACHIDWALLAAIGRVESDHGRYGGSALTAAGIDQPGVYGVELDGAGGTASIPDTDHGVLDHDPTWDRAVGPMQFIPSTWRIVGSDLDGDGVKDPQDINDAAAATAIYLCAGSGDLSQSTQAYEAIRRYNNSDSYARTVLAIAQAYRDGKTMLPLADLSGGSATGGPAAKSGAHHAAAGSPAGGAQGSSGTSSGHASSTASPTGAAPSSDGSTSGSGLTSALPTTAPTALPSAVTSIVCAITTVGSGLSLPPLPLPGCPTPSS